jgi:hypothetical protein
MGSDWTVSFNPGSLLIFVNDARRTSVFGLNINPRTPIVFPSKYPKQFPCFIPLFFVRLDHGFLQLKVIADLIGAVCTKAYVSFSGSKSRHIRSRRRNFEPILPMPPTATCVTFEAYFIISALSIAGHVV